MLVRLATAPMRVIHGGSEDVVNVGGGFLHVTPGDEVTRIDVLVEEAERASD
jgi:F0F1-type ATP synthase epsilon subunit